MTLLDFSPAMLDLAEPVLLDAGMSDHVPLKRGDAAHLASTFPGKVFDLIVCYNVLECVDEPVAMLKADIQAGDLVAASNGLASYTSMR